MQKGGLCRAPSKGHLESRPDRWDKKMLQDVLSKRSEDGTHAPAHPASDPDTSLGNQPQSNSSRNGSHPGPRKRGFFKPLVGPKMG